MKAIPKIRSVTVLTLFLSIFFIQNIAATPEGEHWWGRADISYRWKDLQTAEKTDTDQNIRITSKWSNKKNYYLGFRVLDSAGNVVLEPVWQYRTGYDSIKSGLYHANLSTYNGDYYVLQGSREHIFDPRTHVTGRWTP